MCADDGYCVGGKTEDCTILHFPSFLLLSLPPCFSYRASPLPQLIRVNSPDLVLFVGEALVGNEAVDQLLHFNQALVDHSEEGCPRTIDGILLTKFDTVDDKVCSLADTLSGFLV